MSGGAVRNHSARRHNRNNNASPYSRPGSAVAKKPSGWSLTGFLSYLNPLRSFSSTSQEVSPVDTNAARRLTARGEELEVEGRSIERPFGMYCPVNTPMEVIQQQIDDMEERERRHEELMQSVSVQPVRSPPQSANGDQRTSPRSDDSRVSSSSNLKKVQEFLDEKGGRPLNQVEFAGLVSLLQNSVEEDDDRAEPFRFSKSPSTPARGATPTINFLSPSSSEQMVGAAGTAAQNGRKTLARNPMGVYRWQGGGSARPRNRYQSPGFGSTAARPTIKLTPERPKTDSKRRRVSDDATTSSPQRVPKTNGVSAASSSSSVANMANGSVTASGSQTNSKPNGAHVAAAPATPRVRTSGVIKPTAPAVPSPLRQTWGQSDSPPQSSPSKASKPTRAASFMTELIKEVTPPKKPDFANPYEAQGPVVRPAPKKQAARKTRSSAKAEAEKLEKEKAKTKEMELTPQAIIEATVPKGSKRSRPPPELIGQKSPAKRVTSPPESTRRSARTNGTGASMNGLNGVSKNATSTADEAVEEQQPSPKKQRTSQVAPPKPIKSHPVTVEEIDDVEMTGYSSPKPTTLTLPSEVVEPSEEKTEKKRATSPSSTTPSFPGFGPQRASAGFGAPGKSSAPKAPSKLRFSIQVEKDEKMEVVPESPSVPAAPQPAKTPVATEFSKPKDARATVAAMREDELPKYTFTLPTSSPGAGPSTIHARQVAKAAPVSSLPTFDLSKASAPAPAPAATSSGGFNWSAAGMKPPPKPSGDNWSCGVCMLSNPSGAEKCTICDAPREDKPKPAAQGFDWSKAGMKPPPKPAGDTWSCSVCMLSNPGVADKCTVCDSPR